MRPAAYSGSRLTANKSNPSRDANFILDYLSFNGKPENSCNCILRTLTGVTAAVLPMFVGGVVNFWAGGGKDPIMIFYSSSWLWNAGNRDHDSISLCLCHATRQMPFSHHPLQKSAMENKKL